MTTMFKRLFCWTYDKWLSGAVGTKDAPLVKLLDFIAGSECKYCMAVRCLLIGTGIGLSVHGGWVTMSGLALICTSAVLAVGERKWL